ncbi:PACE efflux transporter [Marivita sp. GX14005]|uniref:PACE efflux transporter n=1 Tax=Marivita sp. GX14005 TaxID=2942276 RepID=UPI0020188105|nr:PACE efflux transporter [Marivita sp. GX14005]MCL3881536.1 PACE efflux transporter [Marivita sp. GX14005]
MRSPLDRLRHAISFELLALLIVIPLGALVFDKPMQDIGIVTVISATIATLYNMAYNFVFDLALRRATGSTLKTPLLRVAHAVLFEIGLLGLLLPVFAWYLQISLWQAFVMDVSFAAFYVVYAFCFNWAYDLLFPLPEWSERRAATEDRA